MTDSPGNGPEVAFDVDAAQALLDEVTAPWVRELGLRIVEISPTQSRFHLPFAGALTPIIPKTFIGITILPALSVYLRMERLTPKKWTVVSVK